MNKPRRYEQVVLGVTLILGDYNLLVVLVVHWYDTSVIDSCDYCRTVTLSDWDNGDGVACDKESYGLRSLLSR